MKQLLLQSKKQPPEVFCKKRCSYCNFIKKETLAQLFSCKFCEISKKPLLQNTSGWLLLQSNLFDSIIEDGVTDKSDKSFIEHN